MNKGRYRGLALIFMILSLGGCSSDSVTDSPLIAGQNLSSTSTTTGSISNIVLASSPTSLSALGTAAITATVTDSTGASVTDGILVSFSVTANSGLGSVSSSATTVSGVATSTFTALSTPGVVTVTASASGVSATVDLTILGVDVGSIEFNSASPNAIGVKGSGQPETSIVTFLVKDVNGQAALDGTNVNFALSGPNGGELLTPLTGSTSNGVVTTTLQAGSVAGPVRITATTIVSSVPISSVSTGVSIGGGVPSLPHMTITRSVGNLAGLAFTDLKSTIKVFIADRFGNYNILTGTSVSFLTEAGAMDASNVTDVTGVTESIFRTQSPMPLIYASANPFIAALPPTNGDLVNGDSTIIAITRGEECFVDNNGNGVFDGVGTDTFPVGTCDLEEPYVDANDNNMYDASELYLDGNNNGSHDVGNGVWDANIMIWRSTQVTFTSQPDQIVLNPPSGFAIANGGSTSFKLCVADLNSNAPMGGSTIDISTSQGTILGGGNIIVPDTTGARYCPNFVIEDNAPTETDPAIAMTITVKVTWKVNTTGAGLIDTRLFTGTID